MLWGWPENTMSIDLLVFFLNNENIVVLFVSENAVCFTEKRLGYVYAF